MQNTVAGEHPGADTQPAWFDANGRADVVQRLRNRDRGRGWAIAIAAAITLWAVIGLSIWAVANLLR